MRRVAERLHPHPFPDGCGTRPATDRSSAAQPPHWEEEGGSSIRRGWDAIVSALM